MAAKGSGSEILAVYVASSDGLTSASPKELAVQRTLVEDLGGTFHHVIGDDIPAALLDFARGVNATQIVLGSSRRKAWQYIFGPGVGADRGPRVRARPRRPHRHPRGGRQGPRACRWRAAPGWAAPGSSGAGWPAWSAPPCSPLLLTNVDADLGLANDMLLFLSLTVAAALLGGLLPGAGLGRRSARCC